MAKKKDASSALVSGSAEALGLRRSGRETPTKKQATASPSNTQNSEWSEKAASPNPSPAKKKPEKIEKLTGPSPLRRSDRGKKMAEVSGLPDIKSKKKKSADSAEHSAGDVKEVKENGSQDSNVSDRKRKKSAAQRYKALFQPQRIRLEIVEYKNPEGKDKSPQANTSNNEACLDVDKELKSSEVVDQTVAADSVCQQMNSFTEGHKVSLNSRRVQGISDKDQKMFLAGNSMVLQQVEHVGCTSQTKPHDGKFTESGNVENQILSLTKPDDGTFTESGNVEKQIGNNCSPSNKNLAEGDNDISHISSSMVNHDLENHQECDSSDKVTRACKAAAVMVNAENDDAATDLQNSGNTCISSKFVEFWVPVPISNVQLEQYCATLLSNAMTLRSCSKTDALGSLNNVFATNRKCCNHPYLVDPNIKKLITKDLEPSMVLDADIKASGKLRFLDLILPEVKKRQQRVLVLFQPVSIGHILEDFVLQRFGQESYERLDAFGPISSKKQAALDKFNKETSRFIFLRESRVCNQSIKLLSIDIIIIFDSDSVPATDLRALQKVNIESHSEPVMIFRLYSLSTLEEKILKLAEQNVAIDIKSQTLRSNYDALLTWGASELFNRLTEFHTASVWSISDDSLTTDVVEEFLYIVSHKSKSRDSVKSLITRVQNFGIYAKNTPLHSEIKTHLPNGEQPPIFWGNLLEGRNPHWKFVPESTPRQRKRPNYFLDSDEESGMDGGVKTRRKKLASIIVPAQWQPVIERGSRGINEGGSGPPVQNESQSSSADTTAVTNETSLHDLLKPTVSELCNVLKFSEGVTIIVEKFLKYVLENFHVGKEHTSTLQAFMISLCWIGASLAQCNIDRSESFALATKLLNFSCSYEEADSVYKKLELKKASFLQHTKDVLKEFIRTPQEVNLDMEKSQHTQNDDVSENHDSSNEEETDKDKKEMDDLSRKVQNEINEFNKNWDEKRAILENSYSVDGALIRYLNSNNPSVRSEKLNILEMEYANKFDEHDRLREIHLIELKAKLATFNEEPSLQLPQYETRVGPAVNEEPSLHVSQHETHVGPSLRENQIEAQSHDEPGHDTYVSILNVTKGHDADKSESTRSPIPDTQIVDATVSNEQVGEIPPQQNDDMEIDIAVADATVLSDPVAEVPAQQHDDMTGDAAVETDLAEMELPLVDSNQEHASLDGNSPYKSHAREDGDETAPNDAVPDVDSGDMGMPGENCDEENAKDRNISPDTLHAAEGNNEVSHNDVGPHVDSAQASVPTHIVVPDVDFGEMGMPGGNCDEENAEDRTISPDTLIAAEDNSEVSHNDVGPHVDSAETSMPADNYNEENIGDNDTRPDTSSHELEDQNDLCGLNNNNSLSANLSLDKTSSVQPSATPPSEHTMQTILEIENMSLQVQQPLDTGVQDIDGEVYFSLLAETTTAQLGQITPENTLPDPHDELILPSSTDPLVPENQSNILPQSGLLADNSTDPTLIESSLPSSHAPPLPPAINPLDMFDNLIQVGARIPNHGDPLQAEVERLCAVNHNVSKFHEDIKQRLNSDCEKEITEAIAKIRLKYEAKHQEADAAFQAKKKELETNLNKVSMNRILAEAFRAKCQDLSPAIRSGMQQALQAGLMQQMHRVSGPSSVRSSPGTASTSAGQASGSQQTTPPPPSPPRSLPPQPPLQIVHQPAALFSSTPSRPQQNINRQHPSTTSVRLPPIILENMSARPFSSMDPTSPSTAPTRPPPVVTPSTTSIPPLVINTITPSPTTTRLPPVIINTVTPSTTPTTTRPPPGFNTITPSNPPSSSQPPPVSRPVIPSNPINLSSTQNRQPYTTNLADMSAVNLRINTETRGQTSHARPVANGEANTPSPRLQSVPSSELRPRVPLIRSTVGSESRSTLPHIRSMTSSGIRGPAPHMRSTVTGEIRGPAPHIRPFRPPASDFAAQRGMPQPQYVTNSLPLASTSNSQLPTSSQQLLPPEAFFVPPPTPPSTSLHLPLQRIPSGGPSTDNLNVVMDNGSRFLTPPDLSQANYMDLSNSSHSFANELVCLSDDD